MLVKSNNKVIEERCSDGGQKELVTVYTVNTRPSI